LSTSLSTLPFDGRQLFGRARRQERAVCRDWIDLRGIRSVLGVVCVCSGACLSRLSEAALSQIVMLFVMWDYKRQRDKLSWF
jgi:hypothetical protein